MMVSHVPTRVGDEINLDIFFLVIVTFFLVSIHHDIVVPHECMVGEEILPVKVLDNDCFDILEARVYGSENIKTNSMIKKYFFIRIEV